MSLKTRSALYASSAVPCFCGHALRLEGFPVKELHLSTARVVLLVCLVPMVFGCLSAQTAAKSAPDASGSHRAVRPPSPCDPFAMFWAVPSKPVLLPSPSPSDPGYGSKREQLLNKLAGVNTFGQVMVEHNKGPVCPLSLEAPAAPLAFQIIATPSERMTPSATKLPEWNYPTEQRISGSYRIYRIHYSIAPKDLKLYSQEQTSISSSSTTSFSSGGGTESATQTNHWTTCGGTLEFTTVIYGNDDAIINSTDTMVAINHITLTEAKQMLRSGVGLDQVIAVPASGSFRLRAVVTDPASQRGSESQLTVDAANPTHLETPPVRPNPTSAMTHH